MAASHPLSISRPSRLQPKQLAQTCVNPISVVSCGGSEVPAKSRTSLVKSLRRSKLVKLDAIPTLNLSVPSVPSTPTKKRARKDTLDENGASGDADGRLRVRQRLVSTSSVATIRPHKSIEDEQGFEESSCSRTRTDSRKASGEPLRARPFSEINRAPGDIPQRRLRRVGTIEFPTMRSPDSDSFDPRRDQSSRMPVPTRRISDPLDDDPNNQGVAKSSKHAPRKSREPPSYAAAAAPGPAPQAALDRFDLRVAPVKEHTELWDLPDEYVLLLRPFTEMGSRAKAEPAQLLARMARHPHLDGPRSVGLRPLPADPLGRDRVRDARVRGALLDGEQRAAGVFDALFGRDVLETGAGAGAEGVRPVAGHHHAAGLVGRAGAQEPVVHQVLGARPALFVPQEGHAHVSLAGVRDCRGRPDVEKGDGVFGHRRCRYLASAQAQGHGRCRCAGLVWFVLLFGSHLSLSLSLSIS